MAQITVNPVKEVTTTNSLGQTVTTSTAASFMITPPMSQWEDADLNEEKEKKKIRNNFEREAYLNSLTNNETDPVVQTDEGSRMSRAPIVNFAGQTGSGYPPDPSGAAGPNHYVQAVNTTYRVYDKTGNALTTTKNLNTLWPGSSNTGDPIVMYDRHADRWFISQFNDPAKILIAISTTSDPTGTYYAYTFNLTQFPDYPKYSIWWDGSAVRFDKPMLNINREEVLMKAEEAKVAEEKEFDATPKKIKNSDKSKSDGTDK